MASIIRIKRSSITPTPASLGIGELAYSWEPTTGGKLYIGWGDEVSPGVSEIITAIGGKYYTDKLNHTPGILTPNTAILTDSSNKIDQIFISDININTNVISAAIANTDIVLQPGIGKTINASNSRITAVSAPINNTDAVNKAYLTQEIGAAVDYLETSSELLISADTGNLGIVLSSETLSVLGGTGLSSTAVGNTLTLKLNNTGVIAGSYGSSTQIPTLIVNSQGQITSISASTISIPSVLSIAGDGGTSDDITLGTDIFTFSGGSGITTTVTNNTVTIDADIATADELSSVAVKGISSFDSNNFTVNSGFVRTKNITIGTSTVNNGSTLSSIDGLTSLDTGDITIRNGTITSVNSISFVTDADVINVNSARITNLVNPTSAQDATTKAYVDSLIEGLRIKPAVLAATTANLNANYNNGVLGVGATLTSTTNGVFPTIDDVSGWQVTDGILVKDQANAFENGIYNIFQLGSSTTPWILKRYDKCDDAAEIPSAYVLVQEGTLNTATGWVATVDATPMIVGETDIIFVQFSGPGSYMAGDGLTLLGNEFNVNVDNSTIEISSNLLRVKNSGITNAKLANSTTTFAAESGTAHPVSLGETITFTGGAGVNTEILANQLTISVEDATLTTKGVASFGGWTDSTNTARQFVLSSGNVAIAAVDGGSY